MKLLFSHKLVGAQRPSSTKGLTVIPLIAWGAALALIVLMIAIPLMFQLIYRMQAGAKRVIAIIVLIALCITYAWLWFVVWTQPWFWGFPEDYVMITLACFGLFALIPCQPMGDETTTV